ncbi:hypothetical protein E2C01_072778 [Portunus trituberculatus]|uniref:Uncharacterized protein n=1 Tax=Portunus trituberculatus TaxID=210409 RepID=A0A5B7I7K1_PORTR|nr:hypothetical protein [Portunus trituberculatus]
MQGNCESGKYCGGARAAPARCVDDPNCWVNMASLTPHLRPGFINPPFRNATFLCMSNCSPPLPSPVYPEYVNNLRIYFLNDFSSTRSSCSSLSCHFGVGCTSTSALQFPIYSRKLFSSYSLVFLNYLVHGVQAAGGGGQMETQMYTKRKIKKIPNRRLEIFPYIVIVLSERKINANL